jgi:hypothetical protein
MLAAWMPASYVVYSSPISVTPSFAQDIVAIRVEGSTQTPHPVKATGAIVVREHGGRKPIASQARLCVRPEQAEQRTIARMTGLPLVTQMLEHRDPGEPVNGQTRVSDWMSSQSRCWESSLAGQD